MKDRELSKKLWQKLGAKGSKLSAVEDSEDDEIFLEGTNKEMVGPAKFMSKSRSADYFHMKKK